MNTINITANLTADKLLALKGQIVTLTTSREVKYRKDTPTAPTMKVSTFQCRAGVDYDHLKVVLAGREDGSLPAENQGLKGREWVSFPHLMKATKSGKMLFRCTAFNGNPTKVLFLRNGAEISREDALVGSLASEGEHEARIVFDVTVDAISHINGVAV